MRNRGHTFFLSLWHIGNGGESRSLNKLCEHTNHVLEDGRTTALWKWAMSCLKWHLSSSDCLLITIALYGSKSRVKLCRPPLDFMANNKVLDPSLVIEGGRREFIWGQQTNNVGKLLKQTVPSSLTSTAATFQS